MKISIENLGKAKNLAGQRLHLEKEREKLNCGAPLTFANAKVVFEPINISKHPTPQIVVEIEEHKKGAIAAAILKCITDDIHNRIALLDEELSTLGIEIEDAA